jgi:hypothetical protein
MSVLKHAALEAGINSPNVVSQTVAKAAAGYWFNLNNLGIFGTTPANQQGIANAVTSGLPFFLPIQYNLQANFTIQIDYNTVDGGGHWQGDLRIGMAPTTTQIGSLVNSDGATLARYSTFSNTTWCVMGENYGQKVLGTTGMGGVNPLQYSSQNLIPNPNAANQATNQLAMSGTFQFFAYWDNLVDNVAGDQFYINQAILFMFFSNGVGK